MVLTLSRNWTERCHRVACAGVVVFLAIFAGCAGKSTSDRSETAAADESNDVIDRNADANIPSPLAGMNIVNVDNAAASCQFGVAASIPTMECRTLIRKSDQSTVVAVGIAQHHVIEWRIQVSEGGACGSNRGTLRYTCSWPKGTSPARTTVMFAIKNQSSGLERAFAPVTTGRWTDPIPPGGSGGGSAQRYMFLSQSGVHVSPGQGVELFDFRCGSFAMASSVAGVLGRNWRALVVTSSGSAFDRFNLPENVTVALLNGNLLATSRKQFIEETLLNPPNVDSSGNTDAGVSTTRVWPAWDNEGRAGTCDDWTTNSVMVQPGPHLGIPHQVVPSSWKGTAPSDCSVDARLYCLSD